MKIGLKLVSLMSLALLIFSMGGVASADNAASIDVAISYPCAEGVDPCTTGEAVSRSVGGDRVNVYITLRDAAGAPATAGPNGEQLSTLTASLTSQLGNITPNTFQADTDNVSFAGKAAARAYIDYTDAQPGVDPLNVNIAGAIPLVGQASVNVVAPPAVSLAVRTCPDADYALYDSIESPCNNGGQSETAGASVAVKVLAVEAGGLFTTAPNLEGRQITVEAYADFDESDVAGDVAEEETPVATGTFTMQDGIAQGNLVIHSAGPDGLMVVFKATAVDSADATIDDDGDDDTVDMVSDDAVAIVVAEDVFENGNLIEESSDNCVKVLDDDGVCEGSGTPVSLTVVIVDAHGNAVNGTVTVTGALDGILAEQLSGCSTITITSDYAGSCQLQDTAAAGAGSIVIGPLALTAPDLTGDSVSVYLLPASACGVLDMQVSAPTAAVDAGATVRLTLASEGSIKVVNEGDDLLITAGDGTQLLSSNGFASATTTLQINNVLDADNAVPGIQVDIQVYGPCTNAVEPVCVTVKNLDQCGAEATTAACISDIQPGEPANLAVVGLGAEMESESALDESGSYVGTSPIVIESFILADGATRTTILDSTDSCCDLQVWDEFTNVDDCTPVITCTTDSGFALPVLVSECAISVAFASGAAGTTANVTCGVDTNDDDVNDLTRVFQLVNIVSEIPDGGEVPDDAATALAVIKEGPQDVNGAQINPPPGGEAIIRILPNGSLDSSVNVEITFAEGTVAGAELRNLNGTVVNLPVTITLPQPFSVKRYVVYAPAEGQVNISAVEKSATGLTAGSGTVVFGAACTVTIAPQTPTTGAGGSITFTATTDCGAGDYTWSLSATGCTGSAIDADTGVYTAGEPVEGDTCTDTVRVVDAANGNASAETTVSVGGCTPSVTISPDNPTLDVNESQVFTATTECGAAGTYTWELGGQEVGTGNTYTFSSATEGTFTLTVTDTTNNVEDSVTITVGAGGLCEINVVQEQVARSRWFPLPALITIECSGDSCDFKLLGTRAILEGDTLLSVIPAGRVVIPRTNTILQLMVISPAIIAGGLDNQTETVTVTVVNGGCDSGSDTFNIELLPFFLEQ